MIIAGKHDAEARAFGRTEAARLERLGATVTISEALQIGYLAGRARRDFDAKLLGEFSTTACREVA